MRVYFISNPPLGETLLFGCVVSCICDISIQAELFVAPEFSYVGAVPELDLIGFKRGYTKKNTSSISSILTSH